MKVAASQPTRRNRLVAGGNPRTFPVSSMHCPCIIVFHRLVVHSTLSYVHILQLGTISAYCTIATEYRPPTKIVAMILQCDSMWQLENQRPSIKRCQIACLTACNWVSWADLATFTSTQLSVVTPQASVTLLQWVDLPPKNSVSPVDGLGILEL